MNLKKLAPWNWFKDEENDTGSQITVSHGGQVKPPGPLTGPLDQFHREIDDLFSRFLQDYGITSPGMGSFSPDSLTAGLLKPMVDINASDQEYSISIEIPGIEQKDIKLEISNNIVTVSGEKRQEKKDKGKDYYRMERSYGAFQRMLSLPDDADEDMVEATFKNGVLTVTIPRKALPHKDVKQIQIK